MKIMFRRYGFIGLGPYELCALETPSFHCRYAEIFACTFPNAWGQNFDASTHLRSQGAIENCIAGMSAFTCAQRTINSMSGFCPKYALPPIMSGRQNGYPARPEVSRVGIRLRNPLLSPQVEKRSPVYGTQRQVVGTNERPSAI